MSKRLHLSAMVLIAACLSSSLSLSLDQNSSAAADDAKPSSPKSAADLPAVKELPNPFLNASGAAIAGKADWDRQRDHWKRLFEDYEYGHLPPKPAKMTVKRGDRVVDDETDSISQNLEAILEHDGKTMTMRVRLALPRRAAEAAPVPVLIQSGFFFGGGGGGGAFGKAAGKAKAAPPNFNPNSNRRFSPFLKRGYAIAECNFQEFAIDHKDRARSVGVYKLFGDQIDCGALMAWAWGVHRTLDIVESVKEIDAKKSIVTGHSRYGKAALVAGAFDERIALTVPSHSGCAGAAPFRFIYTKNETLKSIAAYAPHWFRPGFAQFGERVENLPVDQHLLMALVAPRGLLCTEGTLDEWTNPQGVQLTHRAARTVYDFLDAGDKIAIRYRPVGHVPSNDDLLDFADRIFFAKPLPEGFGTRPYPEDQSGFAWSAPR